ncbi:hypothetical protein AB0I69_25750 [Streptomyces sp. NPDC050508]|uniref:hypothetical protein n=1 Tax=Streptomyces sp. NPDC050508 TaxID=3155405 RepID=UPI00341E7E8D
MKLPVKRLVLVAALVLAVVGYALLLWRGPWWIDGAHLRTRNLEPADGVVITGFRTALVALGAGALAGAGRSRSPSCADSLTGRALLTFTRPSGFGWAGLGRE